MSDSITTHCPECNKAFELDASNDGKKGQCDVCQTKFIITRSPQKTSDKNTKEDQQETNPKTAATLQKTTPTPTEEHVFQPQPQPKKSSSARLFITTFLLLAGACAYLFIGDSKSTADDTEAKVNTATQPTITSNNKATLPKKAAEPALKPLAETFPVITEFNDVDIRKYRKTFPDVYRGWMPSSAEQTKESAAWQNYLGPLGIRTRSYVSLLQGRKAFQALVPQALKDQNGNLALTAAEVTFIAPDSPADGHLKVGDLIVAVENEYLKSGSNYRPDWTFMHKKSRELQLMLGEKIDQAQARGDIRFTVLRYPDSNKASHITIEKQTLWSGKSGDKSIGVQTFDIALPAINTDKLYIETNQFDKSLTGDNSVWLGLTLEGDYGTKSFLNVPRAEAISGHGRISVKDTPHTFNDQQYSNSIHLHAQGHVAINIPKGTKRIKGAFSGLSRGKVQPFIRLSKSPLPLTGEHKKHLVQLRFPIGKTGSFSSTYPKNCKKSDQAVERHTKWLASQQHADGYWPRLAGYTTSGWDTSWAALALMSSGEAKYDAQVRKAAYYIAYNTTPSEWTAERAMRVIFLSEYYLRHKDEKIVPGIQAAFNQLQDCAKTDYMAGHKVNGFGYGIAGQHYGTGHLALATAIASRTPITIETKFLNGVIQHAGEVCVNGKVSYGRGSKRKRDDSRKHGGGNAMSGPMMLGAMIAGGNAQSIKAYLERLEASLGDGDNSHSTSSLAFIFSSLSMAAENEELFLKHMQNFRYKMTIDDLYAGGYLKSAFSMDLAAGENVTANWIRTAGHILILNSLKHNLAITGKKDHWAKSRQQGTSVTEWGAQIHTYYLRNACITKELLGKQAPKELKDYIKELHALKRDSKMVPKTRDLVLQYAPKMVKQIAANSSLQTRQRAYAIELLSGLDFVIRSTRKDSGSQVIKVNVYQPLHMLNWLDEDKEELFKNSPFALSSKIVITSNNIKKIVDFKVDNLTDLSFDKGYRSYKFTRAVTNNPLDPFKGEASIEFNLGGVKISYKRPLFFNQDFAHGENTGRAPNNINLRRFLLKLRMAPRAIYQSQPLIIGGIAFDCMYPSERMADFTTPEEGIINIHEGDKVTVDMSSETPICGWVHQLKFPSMNQVSIRKAPEHKIILGNIEGDLNNLYDTKTSSCKFTPDKTKKATILEYDFKKPTTINGLDITAGRSFFRIWYKKDQQWIPITWDNYSSTTSHTPSFPATTARLWRVELKNGRTTKIQTLRFYHNNHLIDSKKPLHHTQEEKFYPQIKPQ